MLVAGADAVEKISPAKAALMLSDAAWTCMMAAEGKQAAALARRAQRLAETVGGEVTLPKTLEDGKFRLVKDMSGQAGADAGLRPGEEGVMGAYGSKDRTEALLFSGINSDRAGSAESEPGGSLLNGMEKSPNVTVEVPRRQITPAGGGEELSCEVISKSQGSQELTIKVCAWTDDGSSAAIVDDSPGAWSESPSQVDLEAYAERVDLMRDEVREPSGGKEL